MVKKVKKIINGKKRLAIMFYIVVALFVVIFVRMADLMFVKAEELQTKAESQWTDETTVAAKRGDILDSNGKVLATSASVKSVLLKPHNIKDPGEVSSLLAPILEMDSDTIYKKATSDKTEVWLKRQITSDQADKIEKLGLDGVALFSDTKRYYIYNDFASQVIGYTNVDGDGQEGIEKAYNKYLSGYDGTALSLVDAMGRTVADSETTYVKAQDGLNVTLTIDSKIQNFAETAAREAYDQNDAKGVGVIVMDPSNADILAMVNYPGADLNNLDRSDTQKLAELTKNKMVTDAYEPGSTFKIITLSSALSSGTTTEASHFLCTGAKIVDGEKISCWRTGNPHGNETLSEAVQNSCNPAFMTMALDMGTETFYDYIHKFGFGQKTGIDFSTDGSGIVSGEQYVRNTDLARIGFGQSIAVTPLQLVTAVSASINGGTLYTPRLVSKLTNADGKVVKEIKTNSRGQVITSETSSLVRKLLQGVVEKGSGKNAKIEGYTVGGKTGTAQIYDENGKIVQGKHISSFIGFTPVDNPKYLCLFIVYEPNVSVDYGGVVAAPFAKDILEKCLKSAGVEASGADAKTVKVPDFLGMTKTEAEKKADAAGVSIEFIGTGNVKKQSPAAGTEVTQGSIVDLVGAEETVEEETIPNLVGKTLSEAYTICSERGLEMVLADLDNGDGIVASQTPEKGTVADKDNKTVTVRCGAKKTAEKDEAE